MRISYDAEEGLEAELERYTELAQATFKKDRRAEGGAENAQI